MTKKNKYSVLALGLVLTATLFVTPQPAFAKDDFGKIVHHIEANYQTHRRYRWVMGLAGFTVKVTHLAGVKNFKGAIFENCNFSGSGTDTRFDEVVRAAMDSGWQPMVQSYDRRSGERTYIYAQNLGKDMKILVVNLEQTEAVVIQVKLNPNKLADFVNEASSNHGRRSSPQRDGKPAQQRQEGNVEVAAAPEANSTTDWDGICLLAETTGRAGDNALKVVSRL